MKKFKKLSIFDFDGTIANVPEKPVGGDLRGWNGRDWWGSRQSLCSPEEGGFYDGSVNKAVVDAFIQARNEPETLVVMATGRRSPAACHVRAVLRKNGLFGKRIIDPSKKNEAAWFERTCRSGDDEIHPDESLDTAHEEYYCGDVVVTNKIPGTFGHKKEVIERLVDRNGDFETIEIWDDRKDHIELYQTVAKELLKRNLVQSFVIYQVYAPASADCEASIVRMPVTESTSWKNHG